MSAPAAAGTATSRLTRRELRDRWGIQPAWKVKN